MGKVLLGEFVLKDCREVRLHARIGRNRHSVRNNMLFLIELSEKNASAWE